VVATTWRWSRSQRRRRALPPSSPVVPSAAVASLTALVGQYHESVAAGEMSWASAATALAEASAERLPEAAAFSLLASWPEVQAQQRADAARRRP
jgi:hypothetical protein